MASNNSVVLEGNLTKDPTLRFTEDGTPVCRFTIAVDREGSKKGNTDYFDVYSTTGGATSLWGVGS